MSFGVVVSVLSRWGCRTPALPEARPAGLRPAVSGEEEAALVVEPQSAPGFLLVVSALQMSYGLLSNNYCLLCS